MDWTAIVLMGIAAGIGLPLFHLFDKAQRRIGELEAAMQDIESHGYAGYYNHDLSDEAFRRHAVGVAGRVLGKRSVVQK